MGSSERNVPRKCARCRNEPTGIVGHLDLYLLRLSGSTMQFRCVTCNTLWTRSNSMAPYVWSVTSAEINGMLVPGRKTAAGN